jgi:UDP-2-acetamido-2-deoxy-ribo-hexuluronate aminotransferase
MAIFADEVEARSRIGARYSAELADCACITPYLAPDNTSVYAQYTLQVVDREALQAALQREGIPTAVHYPMTLDQQPALASRSRCVGELGVARALAERVVSLPMHPYLDAADQDRIVAAVKRFC